jgi:hypothetical protein
MENSLEQEYKRIETCIETDMHAQRDEFRWTGSQLLIMFNLPILIKVL